MITPPARQLLVTPKPCAQCGISVREAWLSVGGRKRKRVRRVVVHNDPIGPLRLVSTNVVVYVGAPANGLAGHEPRRYSLHRTAYCEQQAPRTPVASAAPVAGVTGALSSAAGPRPPAVDDARQPVRAHTAHGLASRAGRWSA